MPKKEETSYGVVLFYKTQERRWQVLLVHHQKGHWGFPKGHSEKGEDPRETALRELAEETGITQVELSEEPVASESYQFTQDGSTINKTASYFLGTVSNNILVVNEAELIEAQWVEKESADDMITFTESREVLECAWGALRGSKREYA